MSDASPGLGDLLALFGGANPLAGVSRSIAQFQKGIGDFLQAVENFNGTMAQMNAIAGRVNALLDDVEPPIRALMPQVTRSITLMDSWTEQLSVPIERVAPGIARLADALSSPVFSALPADLSAFVEVITDVARRLQPLGQLAETAGGLLGRSPLMGLLGGARTEPTPPPPPPPPVATAPARRTPARRTPARKAPAKQAPAKQAPAKKAAAKKAAAKRAPATQRRG